jgi:Uma2 family endonuclease
MLPADPAPTRLSADEYFDLVRTGQLDPSDKVELLEGVVVAMAPQGPRHAGMITKITEQLVMLFRGRASVRVQLSYLAGPFTVPEPDFAVVPGLPTDYEDRHPDRAHLIIEVADSSLPSDRLSKSRIYAAARVPQYLIVNLRRDCVEVYEQPIPERATYGVTRVARRGERIPVVEFPDVSLATVDLLPVTPRAGDPFEA